MDFDTALSAHRRGRNIMQERHVGLAAFFLLLAAVGGARAADPAAYLAARDRADEIEQKAQDAGVAPSKAEEARLRAAIEAQLRLLVGAQPPNGFSGPATMSPEKLLYGDIGAGALDGFSYRATDGPGSVVVTTEGLLRRWLKRTQTDYADAKFPTDPKQALQSDNFYTRAIEIYYPVMIIEPLPIRTPASANDALALWMEVREDKSSQTPTNISVMLQKDGRVYIAVVQAKTKLAPDPDCARARAAVEEKTEGVPLNDQRAIDDFDRLAAAAEAGFQACWTQEVQRQGLLPALTTEAQQIADGLAK
jgi:hypothetical protein